MSEKSIMLLAETHRLLQECLFVIVVDKLKKIFGGLKKKSIRLPLHRRLSLLPQMMNYKLSLEIISYLVRCASTLAIMMHHIEVPIIMRKMIECAKLFPALSLPKTQALVAGSSDLWAG
jgi:hypothetical protein